MTLLYAIIFPFIFPMTHGTIIFPIVFPIMTHYDTIFFLLFSIMTGCRHTDNGTVQTAILDQCTSWWEWLISVHEEGQFNWIYWKARIHNGKLPDGEFLNYYTHYFYYYTHYFSWLTRIAVAVSTSYSLQIYVQRICVLHQAWGTSGKLPLPSEAPKLFCFCAIISHYITITSANRVTIIRDYAKRIIAYNRA